MKTTGLTTTYAWLLTAQSHGRRAPPARQRRPTQLDANAVVELVFVEGPHREEVRLDLVERAATELAMQELRHEAVLVTQLVAELQGHGAVSMLVMDCNEQLQLRGMARSGLSAEAGSPGTGNRGLPRDGRLALGALFVAVGLDTQILVRGTSNLLAQFKVPDAEPAAKGDTTYG